MKKLFFMISCILFCNSSFAKAQPLDSIVAIVNDDVVTQSELNRSLTITKAQLSQNKVTTPSETVLEKQVLDQLINKKLQLQIAKQVGIHVTDADIDHIIKNVANKNNITVNALYQRLNQDGMSISDYRNELREQMTVQKIQQQEVATRITVAPSEITSFMHSARWQQNTNKEYRIEDVLIPLSDTASSKEIAAAKQNAQGIADKLNKGQPFAAITQTKIHVETHDLGWRKLSEIPSVFTKRIVGMQPNEIAGPISAGNGFHIIRLTDVRSANSDNASQPDRNQVQQFLMQRKFESNVQNWLSKVRGQAFISMK